MLPKTVYKQAYKDITNEYHKGVYDTKEWFKRVKAICEDFDNNYPPNSSLFDEDYQ